MEKESALLIEMGIFGCNFFSPFHILDGLLIPFEPFPNENF